MHELIRVFFRHGHHEGIVVTLNEDGTPNTAPMGVDLSESLLLLKPYLATKTYSNLRKLPELTINLTWDSTLFYKSLYMFKELIFKRSKSVRPPIIDGGIDLYVEGEAVKFVERPNAGYCDVLVKPIESYAGNGSRLAYSRADALLIEVMIYLTKAEVFSVGNPEITRALVEHVVPDLDVAERLGSDEVREIALDLRHRLEGFRRD